MQIYFLILERRPVRLRDEEHELHQLAFRSLTPREFKRLTAVSSFRHAETAERLVEAGRSLDSLMVIMRGEVHVRAKDGLVASLREGQFIGEMSYLTGSVPTVEVVAARPTRYASIESAELRKLLEQSAELRASVQSILGMDLVHKLRT
jgi:CRP-like cAMP-binding protein